MVHVTEVVELHDVVWHRCPATTALVVNSPAPKLSPATVVDAPPETGVFRWNSEITAASNENAELDVPTIAATVIDIVDGSSVPRVVMHCITVAADQPTVWHGAQ